MPIKLTKNNEEIRKKAQEKVAEIIKFARNCIKHKDFKTYKERAIKHQHALIKALENYTESDPIKYAFAVNEMLSVLKYSRQLLNDVESEAKMEDKGNAPQRPER